VNPDAMTTGQKLIERFNVCFVKPLATPVFDDDVTKGSRKGDCVITKIEEVARDKNRGVRTDAVFKQVRALARRPLCEVAESRGRVYAHRVNKPIRPPGAIAANSDDPAADLGPAFDGCDFAPAHGAKISVNMRRES
jgi:hypothetical protein